MIPLLAVIKIRTQRNRGFRLWIPLFLAWLLLAPVVLLLLPLFFVLCAIGEVNALRGLATCWQALVGLRNIHVEVVERRSSVLIHTY
jgi:hypothetical protein